MDSTLDTCVFCRIGAGKSPAQVEYQDNDIIVVWDIEPAAPVHLLVMPKKHISSLAACTDDDKILLGSMIMAAKEVAHRRGLEGDGYRLVMNAGLNAGQVVDHIHLHILGGGALGPMTSAKTSRIS